LHKNIQGATNLERLSQIKKSTLMLILHLVRILFSNKWDIGAIHLNTCTSLTSITSTCTYRVWVSSR